MAPEPATRGRKRREEIAQNCAELHRIAWRTVRVEGSEGAAEAKPLLAREATVAHLPLRVVGDGLEQQLRLGLALVVEEWRELVRELFEFSEGQAAVA